MTLHELQQEFYGELEQVRDNWDSLSAGQVRTLQTKQRALAIREAIAQLQVGDNDAEVVADLMASDEIAFLTSSATG